MGYPPEARRIDSPHGCSDPGSSSAAVNGHSADSWTLFDVWGAWGDPGIDHRAVWNETVKDLRKPGTGGGAQTPGGGPNAPAAGGQSAAAVLLPGSRNEGHDV
jgi:hypothetical protein